MSISIEQMCFLLERFIFFFNNEMENPCLINWAHVGLIDEF
jgi:hypothetical protein